MIQKKIDRALQLLADAKVNAFYEQKMEKEYWQQFVQLQTGRLRIWRDTEDFASLQENDLVFSIADGFPHPLDELALLLVEIGSEVNLRIKSARKA